MSDKVTLTSLQRNEIAEQFAELVVDGMDTKDLVKYVYSNMMEHFVSLTADELEEEVYNHDEQLWEELVDNVTNEIAQPKVTITPQELEGDISTITDDDYADKVDTLVDNMVANDDNVYTHDSEGC